jgi:hypothetical protein
MVKALSILDKDGDRVNVRFEGVARQSVQTAFSDHVFAKAKDCASAGDVMNLTWRSVMGNEREQAILKEGEVDDAVHYWYELVELDVD